MNDVGLEYLTLSRAGADALGRRVAAHRPRLGARRLADRDALRPRRADDRPPRRRHAPPARDPAAAGRPRQHRRRRGARSRGHRGRGPRDRPRPRRRAAAADSVLFAARRAALARVKGSATGELLRRRQTAGGGRAGRRRRSRSEERPTRSPRVVPFRRAEGAITIVGARAAQPAEPDGPHPARAPRRGRRRLGLRQVHAGARHPAQRLRAARQGRRAVRRRRARPHRRPRGRSPTCCSWTRARSAARRAPIP